MVKRTAPYAIVLALYAYITYSNVDVAVVKGDSMSPLVKSGQTIWGVKSENYKKDNIVIADVELEGEPMTMVKRVYGVEGDSVRIEGNNVYINEELSKILKGNTREAVFTLGKDEYLLLGDNPSTVWVRASGSSLRSRMEGIR